MVREAYLFLLLSSITLKLTTQVPILQEDVWNLNWPFDLEVEDDDESRSVKTTKPLFIICKNNDDFHKRRNPDNFIIVKPGLENATDPCFVTRHPPTIRSSTPRPNNNVAKWPSIVIGTRAPPPTTIVDEHVITNIANQLTNDGSRSTEKVHEIIHPNLIFSTPNPVKEIEIDCGCEAEVPVHTHVYLPGADNPVTNPSKPITSNSISFTGTKISEITPIPPIIFRQETTAKPTPSIVLTRQPELPQLGTKIFKPTTPKSKIITKIVTSTSNIEKIPFTTKPQIRPTLQLDEPVSPATTTTGNMSSWGTSRLMWLFHLMSKHALLLLFGLLFFGIVGKFNENSPTETLIPYTPNLSIKPHSDYSNLINIYDNALSAIKHINYNLDTNTNYPLPTNYAHSQNSDVYNIDDKEKELQLDYILNVINNYKNYGISEINQNVVSGGYG